MSEKVSSSIFPEAIKGSPIDYAESLINSFVVDASRRPYILARLAVGEYGARGLVFADAARKALIQLDLTNQDGLLHPPLSEALENEIHSFINVTNEGRQINAGNAAAYLLLNLAIDEGCRP